MEKLCFLQSYHNNHVFWNVFYIRRNFQDLQPQNASYFLCWCATKTSQHINNMCNLRFSQYWLWRFCTLGLMLHRLACGTNISDPKDGSMIFLPNTCIYLLNCTASHPTRQHSFSITFFPSTFVHAMAHPVANDGVIKKLCNCTLNQQHNRTCFISAWFSVATATATEA